MQPIITGLLSYGMSGRIFHAPFIHTHAGFNLYAVTERHNKTVAGQYPEVISYNSVDELLNDEKIELVIVNTPNNTHYEYAKKALLAGKHILVEKPFAATSKEARELFALGKEKGLEVMVYQNRRWDSDFQSVKQVIESGKLGKLIEVHFRYDRYRKELSPKTFKENPVPASGISFDLGPHLLDQVISLFGKPLSSNKTTGIYRPGSKVDDYMAVHLSYPDQLQVYVTTSLLTADPLPAFVLHGADGSYIKNRVDVQEAQLDKGISPADAAYGIEPAGSEGRLSTIDSSAQKHTTSVAGLKGNYSRLFDAVYAALRSNEPYPIKEEHILWQLGILEGNL